MATIGKVRRMKHRDKKSIREIAKQTSLSRITIRKWLKEPIEHLVDDPKYKRAVKPTLITPYEAWLDVALKADSRRAKHERRTAHALWTQIKAQGFTGDYSRVTQYVRAWRGSGKDVAGAFVPLKFELGEAFQFDWSEEPMVIGGVYHRMQVAHLKLCASRAFWLVAYPSQGHEMLFDAHTQSFAALGGVPRRGIYDNMKTAVDKVGKGKERTVNARFSKMCNHYLFDSDFCTVASGWEKGVVEKNVQDSRRRIWIEAATMRWSSFEQLNAWLGTRCKALWSELPHPNEPHSTVADMLEIERTFMMPMPTPFDGYAYKNARVSSTCLVTFAKNRYSVPCELAGQQVSLRVYPTKLCVVVNEQIVATHARLRDQGHTRYDWQHYIALIERKPGALRNGAPFADMPETLQQLRRALIKESGGDRVIAEVLALVPQCGLEAVEVAVALALESSSGGRTSLEHIINVVNRLSAPPAPPSVETTLMLTVQPLADTAKFDGLRDAAKEQEVSYA
jgi:transposase